MKYKITYEYSWYYLGCDCCTDSTSIITVCSESGAVVECIDAYPLENADDLMVFIREHYPQYSDAVVDEDYCHWI